MNTSDEIKKIEKDLNSIERRLGSLRGGGAGHHNILSAVHSDALTEGVVRGDLIIGNATPQWSRLPKGNDNQILSVDGADVVWEDGGSGAGYTFYDPGKLAGSPEDDHFDDDAIDVKWVDFNIGVGPQVVITESLHHLQSVHTSEGGARNRGKIQALPGGDFTIEIRVSLVGPNAGNPYAGLSIWEDALANPLTSDGTSIQFYFMTPNNWSQIYVIEWNDWQTIKALRLQNAQYRAMTHCWLRMRYNGTTLTYEYSTDGIGWKYQYAHAIPFTPDSVGLITRNSSGSTARMYFDYFRYLDSDSPGLNGDVVSL